jgi:uncharacterized protein YggE
MKYIITIIVFSSFIFPQQNDRSIEVKGTGTYAIMPDVGVLTMESNEANLKFADAVKGLNRRTEQLTAQLQTIGFTIDEIKTADFSVSKNIVWENNANVDKGYIARQTITVEFPNTKEKIGTILNSFMNSENEIRFFFHFTLSESKELFVKNELLQRAVNDAQSRAEVIATAAKQKLGKIRHISYGLAPEQMPFRKNTLSLSEVAVSAQRASGFDIKEMSFSDEVTIVWELK